ncbi:MAG TPA: winged helix-turn-helix domain-containing protein [Saprospiraceae bacterium]|nr:winged helix-turn-helix domain-containing protein [Saprospiraceae bacterium]
MGKVIIYEKAIKEEVEYLEELERQQRESICRDRVRFIKLLKSGQCKSQAEAGAHLGLGLRQSQRIWGMYKAGGMAHLVQSPHAKKGYAGRLDEREVEQLLEALKGDQHQGLKDGQQFLAEQFGKHYTLSGMHYLYQRLKVKKKTARPVNERQDTEGLVAFKKTTLRS